MIEVHPIGGYNECGKNMTAIDTGKDVFAFDAGLHLPAIVGVQEREKIPTEKGMRAIGALPDDLYFDRKGLRDKVRAILISHAHLDHVGAAPYIAGRYNAKVLGTPFTTEVLKGMAADNNQRITNKIISVNPDGSYFIKGKDEEYKVEFINITHSTIQSTMVAVHTKDGVIIYANDYKLDDTPVMGNKPNYKRLKELSKIGVKAIISNCLYAHENIKTPSEKVARDMLKEVLLNTDNSRNGIVVSTFSSHIARLKSITEFGLKLNRKVIFAGRSLDRYVSAATKIGHAPFRKDVQIVTYKNQLERVLKRVNQDRQNYLLVCTGHQGEPGSILDRMAQGRIPFKLQSEDQVIFSSKTIPAEVNIANKAALENKLKKYHVRIFDKIHVSGHGGKEDIRHVIKLVNPEHFIPSHGDVNTLQSGVNLAEEMGYKLGVNTHIMSNGKKLVLK